MEPSAYKAHAPSLNSELYRGQLQSGALLFNKPFTGIIKSSKLLTQILFHIKANIWLFPQIEWNSQTKLWPSFLFLFHLSCWQAQICKHPFSPSFCHYLSTLFILLHSTVIRKSLSWIGPGGSTLCYYIHCHSARQSMANYCKSLQIHDLLSETLKIRTH